MEFLALILVCALLLLAVKYAKAKSRLTRERVRTQEIQESLNEYIEESSERKELLAEKEEAIEAKLEEGKEISRHINQQMQELKLMEQQLHEKRDRSEPQITKQPAAEAPKPITRPHPRKHYPTDIPELDGPGMQHRLTSQGPNGHAVYVLESIKHGAWKVGISRPDKLADRIRTIRKSVPDARLIGTHVFTSADNAFAREQETHEQLRSHRYWGVNGDGAGRTEWFSVKPSNFTTPERVEELWQERLQKSHVVIDPDNYTIYLMYSPSLKQHLIKFCMTSNLSEKLKESRAERPDAELVARFPIATRERAFAICNKFNERSTDSSRRRRPIWFNHPPETLERFSTWTAEGKKKQARAAA